jgi:hypothetical protein
MIKYTKAARTLTIVRLRTATVAFVKTAVRHVDMKLCAFILKVSPMNCPQTGNTIE